MFSKLVKCLFNIRFWSYVIKLLLNLYDRSFGSIPKLGAYNNAAIDVTTSLRFPNNIYLNTKVTIGEECRLWASENARIIIGKSTILGPNVFITSMNHGIEKNTVIRDQHFIESDVIINEDCWIGSQSIILPGVTLGKGTVVAAGAVVTKSTDPYSIVAGVPAKVISHRF
jgi:maltose O-acetyltransferase